MLNVTKSVIAMATCCVLVACASPVELANEKDDLLASAGFTIVPANTEKRRTELETLPANRVVQRTHGERVVFLYADPYACGCLYIGDQKAWDRYRREQFQQGLVREQELTAQINDDASWNWGAWGPGWWY
ncbi:hypothetical protein P3T18_000026 [Paraburkholderia sp. GAS199]|uniref:hypothetical protein n=1 Tax=Paraburkholderia sp. GAS199 TaxID=3035126 RepID=UPI003D1E0298